MGPDVTFAVATGCGVGAFALAAATLFIPSRQIQEEPAALAADPAVWRACHEPACGHLETRHDPSPLGYACRDCAERTDAS